MTRLHSLIFLLLFLAASTVEALDHMLPVDESVPSGKVSIQGGDRMNIEVDPNRCYCCTVIPPTDLGSSAYSLDFEYATSGPYQELSFTERSFAAPRLINGSRFCFSSPSTTESATVRFKVGGKGDFLIRCEETTLYGGFNITATPMNFLEIVSTTTDNGQDNGEVAARITVVDSVSNQTVLDNETVPTVPAGGRRDVNIHSPVRRVVGAAPVVFGPVSICHDGAPGSLSVTMSQYDSSLNLVNQQVFKTRNQLMGGR